MKSPTEILDQARRLPNDEARRGLADKLRQLVPTLEFDERESYMIAADQIEAMCTTPEAPVIREETRPEPPREAMERYAYYGHEIMSDIKELHELWIAPLIDELPRSRVLSILADLRAEFSDEGSGSGKKDKIATQVIAQINEWAETQDEREAFASHVEIIIDQLTPIKRGVDPDRIRAVTKSVGERGMRGSGDGDGMNRGSALDRKKVRLGKDSQLDHTRAGKKQRAAALKTVRAVDPTAEIPKPRELRKPDVAQPKYVKRSRADWGHIASADDSPLPAERLDKAPAAESELYRATQDHPRQALTVKEIERQEEEARAAAEEADGNRTVVKHSDDPEF